MGYKFFQNLRNVKKENGEGEEESEEKEREAGIRQQSLNEPEKQSYYWVEPYILILSRKTHSFKINVHEEPNLPGTRLSLGPKTMCTHSALQY